MSKPAILALADGSIFRGEAIGADGHSVGEVVFNTAMTGYQEILTDPSYARQMVTLTYPHIGNTGMTDQDFAEMFTNTQDVLFCFHGYAGVIHQLVHGRPDVDRFHVRGFREEGTTTTPFDMVVRNGIDRYSLVIDALNNTKRTVRGAADLKRWCTKQLDRHHEYKVEHLEDMPEITDWVFEA